jgi:hypothetical protein
MKQIIILSCLLLHAVVLLAQETIPASGGDATGNNGSVSYTVGQVVYTVNNGEEGSVAQGVQQPYEIFVVSGTGNLKNVDLTCVAYPNPTTNFLTLKISGDIKGQYAASLYDINGKLLQNHVIESSETTISMGMYISGTYFLRVTATGTNQSSSAQSEIKTFKIVKN